VNVQQIGLRCLQKKYRIIITTTKAKFFNDPEGRYTDLKTGEKCRKATIGEQIDDEEILDTCAHEIAHLKYWNHIPEHKSYTKHILGRLKEELAE